MWRGGGPDDDIAAKDQAPNYNGQWFGYGQESAHFDERLVRVLLNLLPLYEESLNAYIWEVVSVQ